MNQLNHLATSREHAHDDDQGKLWQRIVTEAAERANSELSSLREIAASVGYADIRGLTLSITPRLLWTSDRTSNSIRVTLELHMDLNDLSTTAQATTP